jgi:hypothetical protein
MTSCLTGSGLFHCSRLLFAMIACSTLVCCNSAAGAIAWEHNYPKPSGENLVSIANGPPGFVAVARTGEILFSTDGLQWSRSEDASHVDTLFTCVRYTNDRFMAVGDPGAVLFSFDGQTWVKAQVPTTAHLNTCAGANGVYVAAGSDSTLLVSTNGNDWEVRATPQSFSAIAAGETNWIALDGATVYSSSDLGNWSVVWRWVNGPALKNIVIGVGGPVLNSVTFGAGRFVIAGGSFHDIATVRGAPVILYSDDSTAWQHATSSGNGASGEILDVTYANGQFVGVRPGAIFTSPDGAAWTAQTVGTDSGLRSVAASPTGRIVAVGYRGEILLSDNAQTWQTLTQNPREYFRSIEFADGRFVAVGGSPWYVGEQPGTAAVLTSKDGRQWHSSLTKLQNQLSSAAYGRGVWVVTGDDGQIFVSQDAKTWTDASIRNTTHDLDRVRFSHGRFIAYAWGRDIVYTSSDGIFWTKKEIPGAGAAPSGRFLNGRFVAPGTNGLVMFSHNGTAWRARPTPATQDLACVTYAKQRYVAGGDSVIVSSRNGIKWTAVAVPISVRHLKCVNGLFVAIGFNGEMLVSHDAITWEIAPAQGSRYFSLVASGNGMLVGIDGVSLYRAPIEPNALRQ